MKVWKNERGFFRAKLTEESTLQDIFDAVATRLRDGTGIAGEIDRCYYRKDGFDGNACAAGIFMPDDPDYKEPPGLAKEALETRGICLTESQATLLLKLQGVHDYHDHWTVKSFNAFGEECLRTMAAKQGLNYTPVAQEEA